MIWLYRYVDRCVQQYAIYGDYTNQLQSTSLGESMSHLVCSCVLFTRVRCFILFYFFKRVSVRLSCLVTTTFVSHPDRSSCVSGQEAQIPSCTSCHSHTVPVLIRKKCGQYHCANWMLCPSLQKEASQTWVSDEVLQIQKWSSHKSIIE